VKITYTCSDGQDFEEYPSLEALADELEQDATEQYAETVLGQLRAGAVKVTVANGSSADTYTVTG
jgi:hypothetical protein